MNNVQLKKNYLLWNENRSFIIHMLSSVLLEYCAPRFSKDFCHVSVGINSSLPMIHKVGNAGIFVLVKFENKRDREINHFNYHSKHYDKYRSTLKLIKL